MKSLLPTQANDEFSDSPDIYTRIKTALHISLAKPYGKKLAAITEYFNQFTQEQQDAFVDKLAESKWVRNPMCTYDFIVKQDLVTEILSGGMPEQVSKYYKVTILEVER
jgi:hypothetical protein